MATAAAKTTDTEDVVRRGLKRTLPCRLTRSELTDIAISLAKKDALRTQLKADLDKEKAKRVAQIDEVDDEIKLHLKELHTEEQDRVVPCNEVFRRGADGTGYIHVIRMDTMAEVEKRAANAQEAQRYLPAVENVGAPQNMLDVAKERQKAGTPGFDPLAGAPKQDAKPTDAKPDGEAPLPDDGVPPGEVGKRKAKKGGGKKRGAK